MRRGPSGAVGLPRMRPATRRAPAGAETLGGIVAQAQGL
jgi:hypothetical protein